MDRAKGPEHALKRRASPPLLIPGKVRGLHWSKGIVGNHLRGVLLLFLASGCQTDHSKNCEDLCEALVECSYERVCQYVVDKDVHTCRKNCAKTDGTFDMECTACLAAEFSCEEPVGEECEEACVSADFVGPVGNDHSGGHPPGEWFCDGEPLVPNR